MDDRRELEKELYRLYALSRIKNMTEQNRADILRKIDKVEDMLEDDYEEELDEDEIDVRREVLKDNSGLNDIFSAIWFCCSEHVTEGILRVQGFVKFYLLICKACGSFYGGEEGDKRLVEKALSEYVRNVKLYRGEMSRGVFNDILFKIIELHTEFVDPMYYSAFAWSLLDTVTDLSRQPPAFRPLRVVKSFMTGDNEAAMITNYLNPDAQKQVSNLKVANEWMDRVPDVMQRIGSRRKGKELTETDIQLVAILANKLRKDRQKEKANGEGGDSEEYSDTDSEDGEELGSDEEGGAGGKGGKRSNLEKVYDSIFNGKNTFDINAFKDRKRVLRKMGVGRTDWLDFQKDPNMPIRELGGAGDGMVEKVKKSKFGTWVAGSTLKKNKGGNIYIPTTNMEEYGGKEKPKGKTFSAGGKATHTWEDKMVYLQHKNNLRKKIKITKTRALTPQTPGSPIKKGPEARDDVLGQTVDAGVTEMYADDGPAAISEPIMEEKGEFDTEEWATFRMSLQKMKEDDVEIKKRVEEERVRIEAEIDRRKEDMRREMEAYRIAREQEQQAKKDKVADTEKEEQDYVDGLLVDVDHEAEIAAHPSDSIKKIQHPHPDPNEDYLPGPVEFKLEEPTPILLAKHAIDDASEFNPTFDEQYELDSFFSASGPGSVDTGLTSEELAAALIGAAHTASVKKKRREDKMARIVLEDEETRGKWRFGSSKVRHLKEEDSASHVSGGSSAITISVPNAKAMADSSVEKGDDENNAAAMAVMIPEPSSLERVDSVNDLSVASVGSEYGSVGRNYAEGYPLGIEGGHPVEAPLMTDTSERGAAATIPTSPFMGSLHNLSQSQEISFDDQLGGRPGSPGFMVSDSLTAPRGLIQTSTSNPNKEAALPFPHKSYSTLVEGKKLDGAGGDGKLGSWNHERAAAMQLRTKNPLRDEKDLLETDLIASRSSKSLEALKIQKRELPWFRSDHPPRVRGLAYNPSDSSKAPAPQRPVMRPEYKRELMGSSGSLLLLAKQRNTSASSMNDRMDSANTNGLEGSIDVSVPQASVASMDSAVNSTGELSAQLEALQPGVSIVDSLGSVHADAEKLANTQSNLNLLSSTHTTAEMAEQPIIHSKRAVIASNDEDVGAIGIMQAPVDGEAAGYIAVDSHGERLMTGVEPPTTADGLDMTSTSNESMPHARSPGLRILRPTNTLSALEPDLNRSASLELEVDALGTQVRNHLVKSIVSGSQVLLQTNPALSPETKNPAKPKNLVDGPYQNVATGFLKEPEPLPSPNRSRPLTTPQGHTLLVRSASMSSRDWLMGKNEGEGPTSPAREASIPQAKEETGLVGIEQGSAIDDDEVDNVESVDGEGSANAAGDEASIVSFLTLEEPPLGSPSLHLQGSTMNDSLVDKSKSLSQVMAGGSAVPGSPLGPQDTPEAYHDIDNLGVTFMDTADATVLPLVKPHAPSLVIKGYRTIPAILTEDSAIVPNAVKLAAIMEIETKRLIHKAIMTDTLTSEASAAQLMPTESLATGSLVAPSGSLQSSMGTNGFIVAAVERHFDALAPPRYDPVGPASAMGLETIEHHPRFKYTGLPGPKQRPVPHYNENQVSTRAPDRVVNMRQERLEGWASGTIRKMSSRPVTPVAVDDGALHIDQIEKNLKSVGLDLRDSRELAKTVLEQPPPFWLPKDLKKADSAIAHDRSNHINGWNDVKILLESGRTEASAINDRASILMTIKRQEAFLERFKDYSTLANMRDSNPEWLRFKHREEELLPVGNKKSLRSFEERFVGKKLRPKIGKFVPLKKKKTPAGE